MILVDDLRDYPHSPLREKRWCHMVSDSNETELHQFAAKLGLRREWFQHGGGRLDLTHYDLTPRRRIAALRLGAVAVSSKELVRRHYNRQEIEVIPEPLAKAQSYRESLLRMGFDERQIKMGIGQAEIVNAPPCPPSMHMVTMHLFATDGAPEAGDFVIVCGPIWRSWTAEICMLNWNRTDREERKRLYQKHQPLVGADGFLALIRAILAKGIAIPNLDKLRVEAQTHGVTLV